MSIRLASRNTSRASETSLKSGPQLGMMWKSLLEKLSDWYAPSIAFLIAVAFVPGISGAATSPRWAIAAVSLWFLEWYCLPFVAFCFFAVDFDSAVHWAIVCAAFSWGLRYGRISGEADKHGGGRQTRSGKNVENRHAFDVGKVKQATALYHAIPRVIAAFCCGVAVSGAAAIFQSRGWAWIPQVVSPAGLFLNKNFMGETACLALIAALQYRLWFPALICLPALALSTSRASWLAALIALLCICSIRQLVVLLSLCLPVALAAWYMGFASDASLLQRFEIWHGALQNLHWFGSGAYDYSTVQNREPNLHNDWLQLIYEFGIIGLIPMAVILAAANNRGGLPFVVSLLVIGSFGFPLQMPATAWFSAFIVGHFVGLSFNVGGVALCHRHEARKLRAA